MGLLGRLTGGSNAVVNKKAEDEVLLLLGMSIIVGADGTVENSELATMEAYFQTLPEFRGKDFRKLVQETNKLFSRYGGNARNAVNALADIKSDAIRKKCFIMCLDIALSSGDIDQNEDQVLEAMARVLKIDDALAKNSFDVLQLKYLQ